MQIDYLYFSFLVDSSVISVLEIFDAVATHNKQELCSYIFVWWVRSEKTLRRYQKDEIIKNSKTPGVNLNDIEHNILPL